VPRQSEGTTRAYEVDRLGEQITDELIGNVFDLLAWIVSFVTLARFWLIHHHVFARIQRCLTGTIMANFAFLGAISLVPFGASLVGTYEFSEPVAIVVFSTTLGLSAFLLGVFTWSAAREPRAAPAPESDLAWQVRHHLIVVPALAVLAGAAAFVHPLGTMAVWIVEAVLVLTALVSGARGRPAAGRAAG
jgi:uncharacterized membrane protein